MNNIRKLVGRRIKEARETAKMTRTEVIHQYGTTMSTLASWENGQRLPDVSVIDDLARLYRANPSYIAGYLGDNRDDLISRAIALRIEQLKIEHINPYTLNLMPMFDHSFAPLLSLKDDVMLDISVTTITVDGLYLIMVNNLPLLCRASRNIDGSYCLSTDNNKTPAQQLDKQAIEALDIRGRILAKLQYL